jgi:hypothetical protein
MGQGLEIFLGEFGDDRMVTILRFILTCVILRRKREYLRLKRSTFSELGYLDATC